MTKGRLEAFSDGVIAIIITIMVLELKVPHGFDLQALRPLIPILFSYILSFIFVGIYWNNHHHLLHLVEKVSGATLWANLHLLFWLSLIPPACAWMGENYSAPWPIALYGFILLMCGVAYFILVQALLKVHGPNSLLEKAVGTDFKGKISVLVYAIAIPLAFVEPWMAYLGYIAIATLWLVPDTRVEKTLANEEHKKGKISLN